MKTFLNIIWHIPFLGFVFSLAYLLLGIVMCITVIGIPIGLGLFQLSRFFLAPFTHEMVSKSDLALVTGERHSTAGKVFSIIARILYFIPGCIYALSTIGVIIAEFLSLIGIPCGIVWAKSLGTIFNPVDKVCVSDELAAKINLAKSGQEIAPVNSDCNTAKPSKVRYKSFQDAFEGKPCKETDDTEQVSTCNKPAHAMEKNTMEAVDDWTSRVRSMSIEKLNEIANFPAMYNQKLVDACFRELEIRKNAELFAGKVKELSDEELADIIAEAEQYSEGMITACQLEIRDRENKKEVIAKKEKEIIVQKEDEEIKN